MRALIILLSFTLGACFAPELSGNFGESSVEELRKLLFLSKDTLVEDIVKEAKEKLDELRYNIIIHKRDFSEYAEKARKAAERLTQIQKQNPEAFLQFTALSILCANEQLEEKLGYPKLTQKIEEAKARLDKAQKSANQLSERFVTEASQLLDLDRGSPEYEAQRARKDQAREAFDNAQALVSKCDKEYRMACQAKEDQASAMRKHTEVKDAIESSMLGKTGIIKKSSYYDHTKNAQYHEQQAAELQAQADLIAELLARINE